MLATGETVTSQRYISDRRKIVNERKVFEMDRYVVNENRTWKEVKMKDSVEQLSTQKKERKRYLFFHRRGILYPLFSSMR